jgi:hypothetical protein
VDEAAHARLGAAEAGEVLCGDFRRGPLAREEGLADGLYGGSGRARGQGSGGRGLDGGNCTEAPASGSGEATVGDEKAVGLDGRRHGGARWGGSPVRPTPVGFGGLRMTSEDERIWIGRRGYDRCGSEARGMRLLRGVRSHQCLGSERRGHGRVHSSNRPLFSSEKKTRVRALVHKISSIG